MGIHDLYLYSLGDAGIKKDTHNIWEGLFERMVKGTA